MYRMYNPNSGEHFYTANSFEKDSLTKSGWKYEGIGWYAPTKSNAPSIACTIQMQATIIIR